MKRTFTVITILLILFSFSSSVSAAPRHKKSASILPDNIYLPITSLSSEIQDVINIGETVILTAVTQKRGSSYIDGWSNAAKKLTVFDEETGNYVSKAEFTAENPGIFTIRYNIDMFAGKSDTVFSGCFVKTIKVVDAVTIVGADIRDLEINPIYNGDGSISAYSASGTIYTLWSNNTATPYSSILFFFAPDETTKAVNVALNIDGKQYTYCITVQR